MVAVHERQMVQVKEYFKQTTIAKMRPTSDILNMRKIEQQMRSQKNYLEAKKVMTLIKSLEA